MLQMVITDLDGTLANPNHQISQSDLDTLIRLGEKNIIRVIATGRSLYSANKVLDDNLPIDFLIFSSGAGVLNWKDKDIINTVSLNESEIKTINSYLLNINADFMLHYPIPENHKFLYHATGKFNPDFKRRIEVYKPFSEPIEKTKPVLKSACQFLVIEPENQNVFQQIAEDLNAFSVIRTTSPLDKKSIWIEIVPANVSKGQCAAWLCNYLGIQQKNVLSIGNDYNDLDLLEWSGYSFVVENAPSSLKDKFALTRPNHESAFMHAVHQVLDF